MSAPQTTTASDVLRKAADLIEPAEAWTQNAFSRNHDGTTDEANGDAPAADNPVCWCAMGAIAFIAKIDPNDWHAWKISGANDASKAMETYVSGPVGDWNDAPERTQAEVVAALRAAADASEAP